MLYWYCETTKWRHCSTCQNGQEHKKGVLIARAGSEGSDQTVHQDLRSPLIESFHIVECIEEGPLSLREDPGQPAHLQDHLK